MLKTKSLHSFTTLKTCSLSWRSTWRTSKRRRRNAYWRRNKANSLWSSAQMPSTSFPNYKRKRNNIRRTRRTLKTNSSNWTRRYKQWNCKRKMKICVRRWKIPCRWEVVAMSWANWRIWTRRLSRTRTTIYSTRRARCVCRRIRCSWWKGNSIRTNWRLITIKKLIRTNQDTVMESSLMLQLKVMAWCMRNLRIAEVNDHTKNIKRMDHNTHKVAYTKNKNSSPMRTKTSMLSTTKNTNLRSESRQPIKTARQSPLKTKKHTLKLTQRKQV